MNEETGLQWSFRIHFFASRSFLFLGRVLQQALPMMVGKRPDEFLFTRSNRKPVKDFRSTWEALTKAANMPGLLFHDLRRSEVRNLVRPGVTERVAMRISGHKSRSVFDRYNIVSESDLADAALKLESGAKEEVSRPDIHSSYVEPAQNEVSSDEENARKPVQ